ncbi:LPXTG-motif cell wall anchor domain-containing protein [Streptomyces prasinopilosus]|uniref:LPXTG-motif cell wall anchor domain-containing protein n=2 Tax=Streptomyces prasinopilosus TaxID=67344 RepID=A0A1G6P2E7_9ACTN|nr:LPXTG-motif cell wall anchor domain-containing protein [Streptomyces prasinopilosus]
MKLRRAMAVAAATAVIAPAALLAAPAAYATEPVSPSPSATSTESADEDGAEETDAPPTSSAPAEPTDDTNDPGDADDTETGGTGDGEPGDGEEPEPAPGTPGDGTEPAPSVSAPAPSPSASEDTGSPAPEPSVCEDTKVDVGISGLPGKIPAGSGWHEFSLDVVNTSDSTLENLDYFAGAAADGDLFKSKQVELQVWEPDAGTWVTLDEDGYAVGYIGYSTELEADYQVNIPMRLNVKASAPVGAGFTFGATIYGDSDGECLGYGSVSYEFQIVGAGTDTDGTEPQEGGKAPVTDKKPVRGDTPKVTGTLAETGAGSDLPMIGFAGGLALVAGTGAVYLVRRRKTGAVA